MIFCRNEEEHLEHLEIVIKIISEAHLKLKINKCSFMQKKIELFRYIVDSKGVHIDTKKVPAIKEFPAPKTFTQLIVGIAIFRGLSMSLLSVHFCLFGYIRCIACGDSGEGKVVAVER